MIKRKLYSIIESHLDNPELTLIVGPRQAGKTTLMKELQANLNGRGQKTLFLSLDNDSDRPAFEDQESLLQRIELEIGTEKGYVFIDEIQRREDVGLFLKGLYDRNLPYKFVLSGSGSVELKEKIHESLAGRKRIFELGTLSFTEFINYKTEYKYADKLPIFFELQRSKAQNLLEEYLSYGGYPKVVLAKTIEEKTEAIKDIYQSYLEKDIAYLLNIQKTESLISLVRLLASQAGSLVNVAELSATLGIAVKTVNDYLWYLEKTFIVERVTPYFKNIRKEITKTPVIYFVDLGLKNYALRQFGLMPPNISSGFLFENFILLLLKEKLNSPATLHFWRTQDKAEVDFVIDTGFEIIPVEVKYTKLLDPETTRSFTSFLAKYNPKRAYVIHLGERMKREIGKTQVIYLQYYLHAEIL